MNVEKLKLILQKQKDKLDHYLQLVKEKQEVLVSNDVAQLQVLITSEQKLLIEIKTVEQEWLGVLKQNLDYKNQEVSDIKFLQQEIKELVLEINRINNINKYLISNTREFIKEVMTSIFKNSKKRSLIDRKI
ncbi:MAG: hypothetical protein SCALA702_27060 [Melioribacteraceae bacterium]|nr:MAG: hypothetical protein SCALA702_27060 [Melioribacteraceae bacterium]